MWSQDFKEPGFNPKTKHRFGGLKMKLYSAVVRVKGSFQVVFVERQEYKTKQMFIDDLRRNGYLVNVNKVKESDVFDYIVNYRNGYDWEWKEINSIPVK